MTGSTVYTARDRQRWAEEPPKRRERTPFERDRARVLHSSALRRLAAKTQVVELAASERHVDHPGQHSPRTRLTHSLECAQIGRELGKAFGCDPDLVEVACLSHDLGHPPFGHNGEAALAQVAAACGGYEGNAQSLRLLTRLEAKSFTAGGHSAGLNLTRAALDAGIKYPWPKRSGGPKYGVYADDRPIFDWVREDAPGERLCFEAQVMDWSDDIAYSVHDLEDGLHAGHVRLGALADKGERRAVCELAATLYCDAEPAELEECFTALLAEPYWPRAYDGTLRTLAALKNLTSELIGRFCRAAEQATHGEHGNGHLGRYAADLVVPRAQRLECALLKGIAAHYVMGRASHGKAQETERRIVAELVAALAEGAPALLAPVFREFHEEACDDAGRLRAVVDQVASLTDTAALAWHREIAG
jgi:dGTPase